MVSAINSTTVEVTFTNEVSEDATVELTRDGGAKVNIAETNYSEDRKSVQLVLPNKFVGGDYTVTVKDGEVTLTEDFELAEEKVEEIKIGSDVAIVDDNTTPGELTVGYQVFNQYGEDVTDDYTVAPTSSQGTPAINNNGTITITGSFTLDSNVTVTLLHAQSGAFVSKTVKVSSEAVPAEFEMKGLYHKDDKTPRAGDAVSGYSLLFTAKDQYGNNLKHNQIGAAGTQFVLNSSNTSVAGVDTGSITNRTIDGVEYIEVPLNGGTFGQGTTVFNLISTSTGKSVNSKLEVPAALAVSKITLGAPEFAVAGETFKVPFTAQDQDGNDVKDLGKLNAVNFTVSNASSITNSEVNFVKDYVTGEIYLEVDATGETNTQNKNINLIATTTDGNVAQRSINLRAEAYVASIAGLKDIEKNLVEGKTVTLDEDNLTFKDQYGRDMDDAPDLGTSDGEYQINVKTSNENIVSVDSGTEATIDDSGDGSGNVILKGEAEGSANITVTLLKVDGSTPKVVANSSYRFTSNVIEELAVEKLELGDLKVLNDIGTTADGDAGFADQKLVVYGVDANGNKTLIPASDVSITSSTLEYTAGTGKLAVDSTKAIPYASSTVEVADVNFIVSAYGKTVNATVKVSKEDAVITKVVADKDADIATDYKKLSDTSVAVDKTKVTNAGDVLTKVVNKLVVTDQYGSSITPAFTADDIVLSNFKGADGKAVATHTLANVEGGSYTVTVLLPNGKTVAINVIVSK